MNDQSYAITVLVIIYGIILLILLGIWVSARRRREPFSSRPIGRRRGMMEQRLLMEAASAIARQRNLEGIYAAIAQQGREMAGFENSIIWLRREDGRNIRVHTCFMGGGPFAEADGDYDGLGQWALFNAAPVPLDDSVRRMLGVRADSTSTTIFQSGVVIPFIEGDRFAGFMLLCGRRHARERRSEQFLTLYGTLAAILVTRGLLDIKEQELRQRRQRAESLAAMGTMAAGLAHEIRNPLTFIRSATEHLHEHLPAADQELSGGILEEIDRINERIGELLALGRLETSAFAPVDPARIINETARLLGAGARSTKIRLELALDNVRIQGDEERLRRLFRNLLVNGIEAMAGEGELCVRGHTAEGWMFIDVIDAGTGIPPEIAARMFEPFFTTKERGTGMGLAIAYGVAKAHGGALEMLETPARGTTFRVSLPLEPAGGERG